MRDEEIIVSWWILYRGRERRVVAYGSEERRRKGEELLNAWAVLATRSSDVNRGRSIVMVYVFQ